MQQPGTARQQQQHDAAADADAQALHAKQAPRSSADTAAHGRADNHEAETDGEFSDATDGSEATGLVVKAALGPGTDPGARAGTAHKVGATPDANANASTNGNGESKADLDIVAALKGFVTGVRDEAGAATTELATAIDAARRLSGCNPSSWLAGYVYGASRPPPAAGSMGSTGSPSSASLSTSGRGGQMNPQTGKAHGRAARRNGSKAHGRAAHDNGDDGDDTVIIDGLRLPALDDQRSGLKCAVSACRSCYSRVWSYGNDKRQDPRRICERRMRA